MRAREPAQRSAGNPRARARGRSHRLVVGRVHPHAGGVLVPDREPPLRLVLRVRAGAVHGRAARRACSRQGAGRIELDQRDDLPARERPRLREVGGRAGPRALELRALPAVLQAHGDVHGGLRSLSGRKRAARPRARARDERALRRIPGGDDPGRLRAHGRRQRLPTGGIRHLRPHDPRRPSPERGACLSPSRVGPPEPRGPLPCLRAERRLRRHARGRSRRRVQRRDRANLGGRGDPLRVRSTHRSSSNSRVSATPRTSSRSASTSCTRYPVSGRTSRTTSRCTSSTPARNRCRSRPR